MRRLKNLLFFSSIKFSSQVRAALVPPLDSISTDHEIRLLNREQIGKFVGKKPGIVGIVVGAVTPTRLIMALIILATRFSKGFTFE